MPFDLLNNDLFSQIPMELQLEILSHLDWVTLPKLAQVSKFWLVLIQSDALWKRKYNDPIGRDYLHDGELWRYMAEEAQTSDPNLDRCLIKYFDEVFGFTFANISESPANNPIYFKDIFAMSVNSGSAIDLVSDLIKFFIHGHPRSKVKKDYSFCERYVGYLGSQQIINELNALLIFLNQLIKNNGIIFLKPGFILIDGFRAVTIAFLKLKQIEQVVAAIGATRKLEFYNANKEIIGVQENWPKLLTPKGFLATLRHNTPLMIHYNLIVDKTFDSKKSLSNAQRQNQQQVVAWLSNSTEDILCEIFSDNPECILTEPAFISIISDRTLLQLCLNTKLNVVRWIFNTPAFIDRLKAIPNLNKILIGLTEGRIIFENEILTCTEGKFDARLEFSRGILAYSALTDFLFDSDLIYIAAKIDILAPIDFILTNNLSLLDHIAKNNDLMLKIASNYWVWAKQFGIHLPKLDYCSSESMFSLAKQDSFPADELLKSNSPIIFSIEQLDLLNIRYRSYNDTKNLIAARREEAVVRERERLGTLSTIQLLDEYLTANNKTIVELIAEAFDQKPEWSKVLYDDELDSYRETIASKAPIINTQLHSSLTSVLKTETQHRTEKREIAQKAEEARLQAEAAEKARLAEEERQRKLAQEKAESERLKAEIQAICDGHVILHPQAVATASDYLNLNKLEQYKNLLIPIAIGYLRQGKKEEAQAWWQSALIHKVAMPKDLSKEATLALEFLKRYLSLPDTYVYAREKFGKIVRPKEQDWILIHATLHINETKGLEQIHSELSAQHNKVKKIIQILKTHGEALKVRAEHYLQKEEYDAAKIYVHRSVAVNYLAKDLEAVADKYFNQDFSNPAVKRNDKKLFTDLSQTIHRHLDQENPMLKEHAGSKRIIYNVLSALGWLLAAPLMIVKTVATGRFTFKADNGTEEFIAKDIAPEFAKNIAAPAA